MWGAITGQRASSCRTEIDGAILGICGPGPVYQISDSMSYSNKANALLQGQNLTKKTPWAIQNDCDLWARVEEILQAKGCAIHARRME